MTAPARAPLWRNRPFTALFAAGLLSTGGISIASVCILSLIYATTRGPFDVAYYEVAGFVGGIAFSLLGGAFVDRYNRRRLMILSSAGRGIIIGSLAGLLFVEGYVLPALLVAGFLDAALVTIFDPAERSVLPRIVGAGQLEAANGAVASSRSVVGILAGAAAAAILVLVGPIRGLVVDSFTFVAAAALIALLVVVPNARADTPSESSTPAGGLVDDIVAGFRWLRSNAGLLQLTLSAMVFNFVASLAIGFYVVYANVALGNNLYFPLILSVEAIGFGIGSMLAGPLRSTRHAGKVWLLAGAVGGGVPMVLLGAVPSVWVAFPAAFGYAAFGGLGNNTWITTAQRLVPEEMQGRYFGVDNLGSWITVPTGILLGAVLVARLGITQTFLIAGIGQLLVGLAFLFARPLWNLAAPAGEVAATR